MTELARLDDPDYELYITKESDWAGYRSQARRKEPWTFDWLKDLNQDSVLYDVGACVGSYSLMAAKRGATVVAFECLPVNYASLAENILLNDLQDKIWGMPVAVSDRAEVIDLWIHGQIKPGYGLASTENAWKQERALKVWGEDLNGLYGVGLPAPTHIKIDVEGGEVPVLMGSQGCWHNLKSVIVEIGSDEGEEIVTELMESHNFRGEEVGDRRTGNNRTLRYDRG